MKQTLKDLSFELDHQLAGIDGQVDTLDDVRTNLLLLVDKMTEALHKGEERACYLEHHRELRLLAELMNYSMKDLKENHQTSSKIHSTMFTEIMRTEKRNASVNKETPSAGNTRDLSLNKH